ncbi:MAG: phosphoribosylamine--glycine ligase [Elusimicrobiota bacterium]
MNVLLIGSGGREHALAWKLSASPSLGKLYAAPGSSAIAEFAECHPVGALDFPKLAALCKSLDIGLVVVGPEDPLAAGITDTLASEGVRVFGPGKSAARLESSKSFAKDFLERHGIPTARHAVFTDLDQAARGLDGFPLPVVVKADGLAAGKGVMVCRTHEEAVEALEACLSRGSFGDAGKRVVVEEFLEGWETSFMGLCDGSMFLELPPSSDHKRLMDGDVGPNTGGMGVVCPSPLLATEDLIRIRAEIISRVLSGLRKDGLDYHGLLYCGLMMTKAGPKVLEFNVRFGDPETQAVLPLTDCDLLDLMRRAVEGRLAGAALPWRGASVCVVMASEGYPSKPLTGREVSIPAETDSAAMVFHAGTTREDGRWRTKGGRVLAVTGVGEDLESARRKAYSIVGKIRFDGMQYRRDIGTAHLNREPQWPIR